ncbi:MAG: HlyD family type I secretion periplasmic adaptor subunit, partial [Burkholderiales bacterium]|nr:HlyD family type I secretion periplasmic adaptor subunit [Burkholderiales bacterium]
LMSLFTLALLWACLGQVDIVAVAPGRIIVGERTKVIQPLEASIVKKVLVKDGDQVQAGQVLVELDPTLASADTASVQAQLHTQVSEIIRTRALLKQLAQSQPPGSVSGAGSGTVTAPVSGTTSFSEGGLKLDRAQAQAVQAQLQSEWADIRAKLAKLNAEAQRRQAEMATVAASIAKLEATLPMAQARETDFKQLVDQGYISGHATQDKTRERVELERDLTIQRARLAEVQATAAETQRAKAAYRQETVRTLSDRQALATSRHHQLLADATKTQQRERQTKLTAPVDGVVQQLAVHSVGGVVTSAQPLMVVVPHNPTVTAEVAIANQDIGFVYAGQAVAVKLETFPYTKYGTVPATVAVVSADAVTDDKRGSFYPATLTLAQRDMLIDGKRVNLSPGMNITAEIKTGQRRIIEFLLSPVQRAGSESLRER